MCVIRFGFDLGLVFFENQDKNTSKQTKKIKMEEFWDEAGSLDKHLFSFSRNQRSNNVFPFYIQMTTQTPELYF